MVSENLIWLAEWCGLDPAEYETEAKLAGAIQSYINLLRLRIATGQPELEYVEGIPVEIKFEIKDREPSPAMQALIDKYMPCPAARNQCRSAYARRSGIARHRSWWYTLDPSHSHPLPVAGPTRDTLLTLNAGPFSSTVLTVSSRPGGRYRRPPLLLGRCLPTRRSSVARLC